MGRVRISGFVSAPNLAESGWRLRIPGGPIDGQYHGYIGPDSTHSWEGGHGGWPFGRSELSPGPQKRPSGHSILPGQGTSRGPWAKQWGGTAFGEGETHTDYVYRSPSEMRPRPNASGGQNVIFGAQDEATAGFAEAPGNYRALGAVPSGIPVGASISPRYPYWRPPFRGGPMYPYNPSQFAITGAGSGATNVVTQPPAFQSPGPVYAVPYSYPPAVPTPAPSVAASPADYLPSQGQVIDGLTPGTPSAPAAGTSFGDWLSESTIIPNVANQWILLGVAAAFLVMKGGKR